MAHGGRVIKYNTSATNMIYTTLYTLSFLPFTAAFYARAREHTTCATVPGPRHRSSTTLSINMRQSPDLTPFDADLTLFDVGVGVGAVLT
jgi:hypothetical protein